MMSRLVCLLVVFLLARPAHAATYHWDGEGGGASGNNGGWHNAANWVGDVVPTFNNTADIYIYTVASNNPAAGNYKNLRANRTIRSLTFNDQATNSYKFSFSNGASTPWNLTFNTDSGFAEITVTSGCVGSHTVANRINAANTQGNVVLADNLLVTHNGSGTLTFGRPITGNYDVIKDGSGTMLINYLENSGVGEVVNAVGCYTGSTIVSNGTLQLAVNGSIAESSDVQLGAGAVFDTTAKAFTMLASQTFTFSLDGSDAGSSGSINAASLDITAGVVDFIALGSLAGKVFVLADYTSLTGTDFNTVNNLPNGCSIDTAYNSGTQIALIGPPTGTVIGVM